MSLLSTIKDNFQKQGVLTQIIVVNIAVFLTVNVVGNLSHLQLLEYLALPVGGDRFLYRFWTLFTYMFTHAGLMHLFWNLILFYFMSQVFFTLMGQKKLLYLYVMSGIAGGALVLVAGLMFPAAFANAILLGASASVLGVGAVMAVYSPSYRVYLFGVVEMSYRLFYIITFVLSTIIDLRDNTGGKIAHIGGALFGLIYGYYLKEGKDLFNADFLKFSKKSKLKVVSRTYKPQSPSGGMNDDERMNALLDKISTSGYDSLTKSEKEELFRLSQKK